jgi:hypothetical protein
MTACRNTKAPRRQAESFFLLPLWGEQPVREANSSCQWHDERPANAGTLRSSGDPAGRIVNRPALRRLRAFEARKAKQLAFRSLREPLLTLNKI